MVSWYHCANMSLRQNNKFYIQNVYFHFSINVFPLFLVTRREMYTYSHYHIANKSVAKQPHSCGYNGLASIHSLFFAHGACLCSDVFGIYAELKKVDTFLLRWQTFSKLMKPFNVYIIEHIVFIVSRSIEIFHLQWVGESPLPKNTNSWNVPSMLNKFDSMIAWCITFKLYKHFFFFVQKWVKIWKHNIWIKNWITQNTVLKAHFCWKLGTVTILPL